MLCTSQFDWFARGCQTRYERLLYNFRIDCSSATWPGARPKAAGPSLAGLIGKAIRNLVVLCQGIAGAASIKCLVAKGGRLPARQAMALLSGMTATLVLTWI